MIWKKTHKKLMLHPLNSWTSDLRKKRKKRILFSSCYIFQITYKYKMENIFAIFYTFQTNQIHRNRIRRIKERINFLKMSPFRLYTHNSGWDSASCLSSSKWIWNKCKNACSGVGKGHCNIYSFSKYLDAHQVPGILLRPLGKAENSDRAYILRGFMSHVIFPS